MNKLILISSILLITLNALAASSVGLGQAMVNPGFYEKPQWFKKSFLDLSVDLEEANAQGKKLILYFHQDGCPYCKKLLADNFTRKDIVSKMKKQFDLVEINMWGDKQVTLLSGEELTEKNFARKMKIMFTPTLVILDAQAKEQFRMNGYYDADKFSAVLDFVFLAPAKAIAFNDFYLQQKNMSDKNNNSPLHREKFIVQSNDLASLIKQSNKPVMLLFEQDNCPQCTELHGDVFRRMPVYQQLKQFTIAQIDINSESKIISPKGQSMTEKEFAQSVNIQYTPSIFFYSKKSAGAEVFRSEAYLKGFHIQALFAYILSGAYLSEPEFQRFVQRRAEDMRKKGIKVDLWD